MFFAQGTDQRAEFSCLYGVQPLCGLVQHDQCEICAQCLRKGCALTVAAAQVADAAGENALNAGLDGDIFDVGCDLFFFQSFQTSDKDQIALHRHFIVQRSVFGKIADLPFDVLRG